MIEIIMFVLTAIMAMLFFMSLKSIHIRIDFLATNATKNI